MTEIMNENNIGRKAIYVHVPVFLMFKEDAEKDGRKYTEFLEMILLERRERLVKKKK